VKLPLGVATATTSSSSSLSESCVVVAAVEVLPSGATKHQQKALILIFAAISGDSRTLSKNKNNSMLTFFDEFGKFRRELSLSVRFATKLIVVVV
jgi:hypothetical protein